MGCGNYQIVISSVEITHQQKSRSPQDVTIATVHHCRNDTDKSCIMDYLFLGNFLQEKLCTRNCVVFFSFHFCVSLLLANVIFCRFSLSLTYLFSYNLLQFCGHTWIFANMTARFLSFGEGKQQLWASIWSVCSCK